MAGALRAIALLACAAVAAARLPRWAIDRAATAEPPMDYYRQPIEEGDVLVPTLLSKTFGSNMVLQRAPQKAVVWGFTAPGADVTTTVDSADGSLVLKAKAGDDGVWRQALNPVEASANAHTLSFVSSTGETATIDNVLFGDVYLCGGQSNMQFSVGAMENATAEAALADDFPLIRLFTVGQKTKSAAPLQDLQTIEQAWSVANRSSVSKNGGMGYFSAVCWVFGREIFKSLGGDVPIGLISNNWGGTPVEDWSTTESLGSCNFSKHVPVLYNAMIHPYTVGPMALRGFTWYQGEANVGRHVQYACTFPAMITAWRKAFQNADAYFGFIQLSTWCAGGEGIPLMRSVGQMAALALPKVGYATNADHGAGCNIHPPAKQYCAARLANSALALEYGKDIAWRSPSFQSQTASASPPAMTVKLGDVSDGGLRGDRYPFNYLNGAFDCGKNRGMCAWASLELRNGSWVNASIQVVDGGVKLTAPTEMSDAGPPVGSRYGWGAVPMMSVYDKSTGLPLLPWSESVKAAAFVV